MFVNWQTAVQRECSLHSRAFIQGAAEIIVVCPTAFTSTITYTVIPIVPLLWLTVLLKDAGHTTVLSGTPYLHWHCESLCLWPLSRLANLSNEKHVSWFTMGNGMLLGGSHVTLLSTPGMLSACT